MKRNAKEEEPMLVLGALAILEAPEDDENE
jgi:hypothetical protein